MIANWFADGQHVLQLAGGAIFVAGQALTLWRTFVIGRRQEVLHTLVHANDDLILSELSTAQKSLERVVATVAGDRRKICAPPPVWANGGLGRRATDKPPDPAPGRPARNGNAEP